MNHSENAKTDLQNLRSRLGDDGVSWLLAALAAAFAWHFARKLDILEALVLLGVAYLVLPDYGKSYVRVQGRRLGVVLQARGEQLLADYRDTDPRRPATTAKDGKPGAPGATAPGWSEADTLTEADGVPVISEYEETWPEPPRIVGPRHLSTHDLKRPDGSDAQPGSKSQHGWPW